MRPIRTIRALEASIVLTWPLQEPAPAWMMDLVKSECDEAGIPLPSRVIIKHVPVKNWMGGATSYTVAPAYEASPPWVIQVGDYIEINYGTGKWEGTIEEKHAVLHEIAHWLTKRTPVDGNSGHDAVFYMQLSVLCLKYDIPMEEVIEAELDYMGEVVYTGLQMYEERYNG